MTAPIVPPATVGMLGGGQLGKYALMAANAMGYRTLVVDPDPNAPAAVVANEHLVAPYDDPGALARLAAECAVVTTEFENAPAAALDELAASIPVAPAASAVAVAQDRIVEKTFMVDHEVAVGPFAPAPATLDDAQRRAIHAVAEHGAIVKTARFGYDGKGQRRAAGPAEVDEALTEFAGTDCIVEALLDLHAEISVIVARTADGALTNWPIAENVHVDGILDVSVVPARVDPAIGERAIELATTIVEALEYVGVLAVEMFVVDGDRLLVNEIAPRPHNSGHWTLDASVTSQFEQQIRAVCGVGLADTAMTAPAVAMVNLLGDLWFRDGRGEGIEPDWAEALADPAATLHLYGKTDARPGRKMGHLTVTADSPDAAERRALALRSRLSD
ncbi:5-(carboxyamino)imidazole ribonucleotide synthase [Ilumatobacter nonamiensis]|uniref:5-(carboxyamino)imidazole ribonucleotide synthase n=1 Tax=Ilumatobacter nonamiensis TaxID=467093 RepID=UPI00034AAE13|nr:5-(carboxyamino)imidazole ribonucleotide synthase [Ilumatobacter nonamiensis]